MSSRSRDPRDLFAFDDPGPSSHRAPAGRSELFQQKRNSSMSLPTPDRRAPLGKRSTTHRLPAYDPDEAAFHSRVTPPRLPALGEWERDGEGDGQPALSAADFTFIAGSRKPGAQRAERRKARGTIKVLSRLAILPLALLLLWGVQGIVANLSGDCGSARARQQQNCFAMDLFPAFSGSQATNLPAMSPAATATRTKLPAIPNDLPDNVRSFITIALPYALRVHQELKWQTSVLLAQWGFEHGWSVPDSQGYN